MRFEIEGVSLEVLRALSRADQDQLLAFGRPISFTMAAPPSWPNSIAMTARFWSILPISTAVAKAVLLVLWRLVRAYATDRQFRLIRWNVHAATCAKPNPRLQRFLRSHHFAEIDDPDYGRIFARSQQL
ncbi:hypothetical protein [Mesorhizobium sp. M1329]|uniref:hypothetical protein n=1 Tax=Mesorhizobium sp. M1329 TaxID=2957083 RepID=UPI00333CB7B0